MEASSSIFCILNWQNLALQASNFGHTAVVELLLAATDNPVDLDAVNIRGQRAEEVAASRGHDAIADIIARFASSNIVQFI